MGFLPTIGLVEPSLVESSLVNLEGQGVSWRHWIRMLACSTGLIGFAS